MFACEHENVRPDLMAIAKGITGGTLPLAATLATDEVYSAFLGDVHECKTFYHGHTYTGNPVACAAACANIDIFRKEKVLARLQPKIRQLWCRLEELKGLQHVGQVRQCGFMVGIELVADRKTKKPYPVQQRIGHRVILEARKNGVIIRPLGDVIVLMPPLAIRGQGTGHPVRRCFRCYQNGHRTVIPAPGKKDALRLMAYRVHRRFVRDVEFREKCLQLACTTAASRLIPNLVLTFSARSFIIYLLNKVKTAGYLRTGTELLTEERCACLKF